MRLKFTLLGLAALLTIGADAPGRPAGYLAGREPDTVAAISQAPETGSPRDLADRAIFRQTRALEGTARWDLATRDVQLSPRDLLRDFSCAVGVSLTPENSPRLAALLVKVIPDMAAAYDAPKELYKRPRPFLRDPGDICVAREDWLAKSYDYPSGHAVWSWTAGLILSELAPDRAGPILGRSRAYGESRVVCGVHNASAVTAGREAADVLAAALNSDKAFRADLSAAHRQLTALRASPTAARPEACEAEAALTARTPW